VFWTFNQDNSGGGFDYDPERGISHFVIVEAPDSKAANKRAEAIGLYFDGQGDCPCCGNRWSEIYEWEKGDEVPSIWGKSIVDAKNYKQLNDFGKWIDGFEVFVHYADGKVQGFFGEAKESAAAFLRSLAQNDYMIDQYFLPEGERLNTIAQALEDVLESADWWVKAAGPSARGTAGIALRLDLGKLRGV
jgi:hypothetical protein